MVCMFFFIATILFQLPRVVQICIALRAKVLAFFLEMQATCQSGRLGLYFFMQFISKNDNHGQSGLESVEGFGTKCMRIVVPASTVMDRFYVVPRNFR
jgi:hypothetical protein